MEESKTTRLLAQVEKIRRNSIVVKSEHSGGRLAGFEPWFHPLQPWDPEQITIFLCLSFLTYKHTVRIELVKCLQSN